MAAYLAKAWYVGDVDDGVYFTVRKNAADKYWVKAVVDDATAYRTDTLMVGGSYGTERDAVRAGIEAAIKWCKDHGVPVNEVEILSLF